jgi:hypothetical protein
MNKIKFILNNKLFIIIKIFSIIQNFTLNFILNIGLQ